VQCGAKKFRKEIGNILSVPARTLQKYKRLGALQNYIVQELKKIKKGSDGSFILPGYKNTALVFRERLKKRGLKYSDSAKLMRQERIR
jgi:hypothetical protein